MKIFSSINKRRFARDILLILLGSILYGISTAFFIFPHALLLGGTSGISVILENFLHISPGSILMIINFSLTIAAFVILGRDMAFKTFIGSVFTTIFIKLFEKLSSAPVINSALLSTIIGAAVIAIASGVMFYVDSSSGGTDIIALIVRKFSKINIGKALLITDISIVVFGGLYLGRKILIFSVLGLLIKTFGIDFIINTIKKIKKKCHCKY